MKLQSRLPELGMAALSAALLVLLLNPAPPATLPARPVPDGSMQPAQVPASGRSEASRPLPGEVAALFATTRAAETPAAVKPATPPERVPWLHYIAFVAGSSGPTFHFFKNDQTGRVLMLALRQPREGWNLAAIQGDTWLLENGDHRYLVTRR